MATFERRPPDERRIVDGEIHERYRPNGADTSRETADSDRMGETRQDKAKKRRLPPPVRASQFTGDPAPVKTIDSHGFILDCDLTQLAGTGGVGKTTIAMQLAVGVALPVSKYPNSHWLDRPINRRGPVIVYSSEDDTGALHRLVVEICAADRIDTRDLEDLIIFDMVDEPDAVLLRSPPRQLGLKPTDLLEDLDATLSAIRPVLVIIDNRAQTVDGNEIDRSVATQAAKEIRRLARKNEAAVILLSHPSLSGIKTGRSGSTGWANTGRNTINMIEPHDDPDDGDKDQDPAKPDTGKRQLIAEKVNYGQRGRVINLQRTCGIFVCTDQPPKPDEEIGKASKAERVFLALLRLHNDRGINVSANPNARNFAPLVFAAHQKRENVSRKAFGNAMEKLLEDRSIRTVEYRSGGHMAVRLEVAWCNS